jgi:hypothetical protein
MGAHPVKTLITPKSPQRKTFAGIPKRLARIYICYNVPLEFSDGISCFKAVSELKPKTIGLSESAGLSSIGDSMIVDPSRTPGALASSTDDIDGLRTAGVTVGLVPDDDLFTADVSDFFILAAL